MQAVVRIVFQTLMGVGKLTPDALPPYPKDSDTWPVDNTTNERLIRFQWEETHQHVDNYPNITWIFKYICTAGTSVCPASGPALRDISDEDLHDCIVKKYQDLQWNIRRAGIFTITTAAGGDIVASDSTEPKPPAPAKVTSQAKTQSRARGVSLQVVFQNAKLTAFPQKLEVRTRKFNNLPETSEFRDEKYRAALTELLMSPNEDELDENNKKTGSFISCAATYWSALVSITLIFFDQKVLTLTIRCRSS